MTQLNRRRVLRAGLLGAGAIGGGLAGAIGVPTAGAAAPPAGGWISVADHGAVGDGLTDDTAAVQAALDQSATTAPSASLYFPPGTYRVARGLIAAAMSDFVLSGHGAALALTGAVPGDPNGGSSVLGLTDCHRFQVLGLTVQDTDRTQIYCGIALRRCTDAAIHEVRIRDVKWTGISVVDSTAGTSTNIAVTDCVVEGTRFGISSNGTDVRITGNHVAMYWPSTAEAAAKGGVWSTPSDYYDGIMVLNGSDRTVVASNTVTECGQGGIYTQGCTNLVVTGNTIVGCQLRGIEVDGDTGTAVGVSITGNVVSGCHGQINLVKARDVTVVGNRTANPNPALASSCLAVNTGTARVVVVGNHADQSHPSFPAVYVDPGATDVTIAWNEVSAATAYQAPPSTAITYRSAAGQVTTSGTLIADGGIGVGNSHPATTVGQVAGKIEVFSATGASLGWVPVYKSIS